MTTPHPARDAGPDSIAASGGAGTAGIGDLVAVVAHARSVPSDVRERFADEAAAVATGPSTILLRTCHRAELYAVGRSAPLPDPPAGGRRLEGPDAVRHLLRVAAGLDSVVIGEDQVLHQLRTCFTERHPPGRDRAPGATCLDPFLERLFQLVLRVGRETRSWRDGRPRSLADVALDLAEARIGPLAGHTVFVVGAGKMARLGALAAAGRRARVVVSNRNHERAAALASEAGGEVAPLDPRALLATADAVVVAISATWKLGPVGRRSLLHGSAPVLDLSSPPALDAATRRALRDRYTSIDDLARTGSAALPERIAGRVARLLVEAEAELTRWSTARATAPAIQALTEQAESLRAAELDRLFRRLDVPPHDRALIEQMTHRLVASLFHAPMTTLRDDSDGDLERAARALFAL